MKLPKELKKKQKQKQEIKTIKPGKKRRKQYVVKPKKKFTETFAPYAIIIAVVFVVIIVVVTTTLDNTETNGDNSETNGDNSNPYQTDMLFQTISGGTINLADHQGEIVILFFFDLGCQPCSPESDIISNIDDDYSNSQVYIVLITIHYWDSDDGLNQFKSDHNLNRPIVRDDNSYSYSAPFNIAYTPTTILLDRDGAEVQRYIGYDANHYNQIKNAINSL